MSLRGRLLSSGVASALLALFAVPAGGAPPTGLALVPIVFPDKAPLSISQIHAAVKDATAFRDLQLISEEEMFAVGTVELQDRLRNCGADETCLARELRVFEARLGLVVLVDFDLSPPFVAVQLIDTDQGRTLAAKLGQLEAGEGDPGAAVGVRAQALFEQAGYGRRGQVLVKVTPPSAQLSMSGGGGPMLGAPNLFQAVPGTYRLRAEAEGYQSGSVEVRVEPGKRAEVSLSLEPEPGLMESPLFWTAAGVAVLGGAAAVLLLAGGSRRCFCAAFEGQSCSPDLCED